MLTVRQNGAISSSDELRRAIEAGSRPAVTLRASGTVPGMHTRFVTSYQWVQLRLFHHADPAIFYGCRPS